MKIRKMLTVVEEIQEDGGRVAARSRSGRSPRWR